MLLLAPEGVDRESYVGPTAEARGARMVRVEEVAKRSHRSLFVRSFATPAQGRPVHTRRHPVLYARALRDLVGGTLRARAVHSF